MPPVPSRLHRIVDTTDVDQAREAFSRAYTRATVEPSANTPFGFSLDVASSGSVHVFQGNWSSGVCISGPAIADCYFLVFSVSGIATGMHGTDEFAMVPERRGVVFSPLQPATMKLEGKTCANNMRLEQAALTAHWTNLTGQTLPEPIRFAADIDLARTGSAAVYHIAQLFRREAERLDGSRLVLASLRDALFTTLLTGQPHNASGQLGAPPPRVAPGCVRRAEEYIAAHATEPITLADVIAAAGVPARSLYAAFESCRGTTPMAFLRDRRLELARQRLLQAQATSSVAGVVRDLGLGNPGRFSAAYKQRFGESPSETLARAGKR